MGFKMKVAYMPVIQLFDMALVGDSSPIPYPIVYVVTSLWEGQQ